MKFHSITAVLPFIFSCFLCHGMDHSRTIKKYYLKHDDFLITFDAPLDQAFAKYRSPQDQTSFTTFFPTEKMPLPESTKKKLKLFCQTHTKTRTVNNIKNTKPNDSEENEINKLLLEKKHLEEKFIELKQKIKNKEKAIQQIKIELVCQTPSVSLQQKNQNYNTISLKEYRLALTTLMRNNKCREQSQLHDKLLDICDNISEGKTKNINDNIYFNEVLHLLYGTVNTHIAYIYYPCTKKISFHKAIINDVMMNIEDFVVENNICPKRCKYYIPKSSSNDSSDSEIDESSDSEIIVVETI